MSRIFVNKIDIDASNIDYASIDRQYDFYLIENHGEKFKPNAKIFDESLVSKNVVAVQYTFGPSFILMLKKDRMNDAIVAEIIKNARDDKNDITSRDVHVFYCIDFNKDSICHYYGNNIGASAFESSPYLLVKNLSKLFEDVSDSIEGDFTMYNDIAPVTYDAIADDMSKSALFNLIDLKSSQLADIYWPTFRDLAGAIHEYRSHERCECECRAYPLNTSAFSSSIVMHCSPHTCEYDTSKSFTSFCISSGYYNDKYNIDNPNAKTSWPFKTYFERKFTQANREIVLKSIYDELKPKVFQYKFMNGNDVPSYQNAKLNGITVRFLS